jgi:ornithine cyclodeaminase
MGELLIISREEVARHLAYADCIPLMRTAMRALSSGETRQLLRSIIDLEGGRAFGVMPGAMEKGTFGAKLVSVYPGSTTGGPSHQGAITLFDPDSGAPAAIVDATEVTGIRTASASAAATDALARPDADTLAILGTGEQALRHAEAIAQVRPLRRILVWGRDRAKAQRLADSLADEKIEVAADVESAVRDADIVCTTTGATEPILLGRWVREGTHVNAVGSSRAGPAEIDHDLVLRARYIADHLESVLRQGAELIRAREAGLVDDGHVAGEIGQVFAGTLPGRTGRDQVTLYKSLGHIVQDLAAGWHLVEQARRSGFGTTVAF